MPAEVIAWRYCGIDPDTNTCAVAFVDVFGSGNRLHGRIHNGWIIKSSTTHTHGEDCCHLSFAIPETLRMVLESTDGMAIEGQEVIRRVTKNPADIIKLAQSAGFWAAQRRGACTLHLPSPKEWKGQVPKGTHHKRICRVLGLKSKTMGGRDPYECPTYGDGVPWLNLGDGINPSDWKHLMDAFGLAIWMAETARGTKAIDWGGEKPTNEGSRFSLDTLSR